MVVGGLRTVGAVGVLLLALTAALLLPRTRLDQISGQSRCDPIGSSSLDRTSFRWQCAKERLASWWTPPRSPATEASSSNETAMQQSSQSMPPTDCSCKVSPPSIVFTTLLACIHDDYHVIMSGSAWTCKLWYVSSAGRQRRRGSLSTVGGYSRLL